MSPIIRLNSTLSCLVCLAFMPLGAAFAKDQVLVNGHIFTANPQQPYAEAVSVRDGRIVAVGNRSEAAASVGADASVTDLGGQTLLPGLIDSHLHAVFGGISLEMFGHLHNVIHDYDAFFAFQMRRTADFLVTGA